MILYFPNWISTTWGNYWEYVVFFGGSLGKSKSFCSIHPYIDNWSNASQEVEGMPLCKNVEFMRSTCSKNLLELVHTPRLKHIFYLPFYINLLSYQFHIVSHHVACRSYVPCECDLPGMCFQLGENRNDSNGTRDTEVKTASSSVLAMP